MLSVAFDATQIFVIYGDVHKYKLVKNVHPQFITYDLSIIKNQLPLCYTTELFYFQARQIFFSWDLFLEFVCVV